MVVGTERNPAPRPWIARIGSEIFHWYCRRFLGLEFHRGSNANTEFIAVTINGTKHYFNRTYSPRATNSNEINVAFQMDGNKSQTDYSVWLDKVTLTYW